LSATHNHAINQSNFKNCIAQPTNTATIYQSITVTKFQ